MRAPAVAKYFAFRSEVAGRFSSRIGGWGATASRRWTDDLLCGSERSAAPSVLRGGEEHPLGIEVAARAFQVMGWHLLHPTRSKEWQRPGNPILRFCDAAVVGHTVARSYKHFLWSFYIPWRQNLSLFGLAK